jgi:DNA polymerase-3 subunit beta
MTATATATTELSVIANTAELRDCLAGVVLAAKRNSPHPALECVHLMADGGTLELRCTDLATQLRRVVRQVQIDGPRAVCAKARDLMEWLKLVEDDAVVLSTSNDKLNVVGAHSGKRSFYTIDPKNFPPTPPDMKDDATITMPLDTLRAAYGFVSHAVADEPSRYSFNGMFFEKEKNGTVAVVATDGRRLAAIGIAAHTTGDISVLIPGEFLSSAIRSLPDDAEADVAIGISGNTVCIQSGDATAWSLLLEGSFPPWRDSMPRTEDCTTFATLDRESFLAAVRRAGSAVGDETLLERKARITFSKQGIKMSAVSATAGMADVNYPCKVTGNDLDIGFNTRFLADALAGMVGDAVEFALSTPSRPGRLTCGPMTAVVMPVNLQ